jgi:predicted nucleic acid-binding protein
VESLILDASVMMGLLDNADAHHKRAVEDVEAADRASTELLVPASAYSEALVAFARVERVSDAREAMLPWGSACRP